MDLLNSASRQSLPSDVASSLRRLEAMLTQGQPRTAQVVQVTQHTQTLAQTASAAASPQPHTTAANPLPAGASSTLSPTAALTGGATQTPSATVTAPPASATNQPLPTTSSTATAAPSSTELYKIQVRLEGRLFEMIAQKPIPPGSDVQISKDSNNRITLQLPTATAQGRQPATNAAAQPVPNPTTTAPATQRGGITGNPALQGQALASGATSANNQAPGPQVSLSASQAIASNSSSSATAGNQNTAARAINQGSNQIASQSSPTNNPTRNNVPNQSPLERIALQPTRSELQLRPGQRVSAGVLSSRPAIATSTSQTTTPTVTASPQRTTALPAQAQSAVAANKTDNQLLRLNVQGQKIELVSPKPLPPGSQLQIVKDNNGQLWAELPTAKTKAIEQVLREHLPQQQSPAPLLNLLNSSQASGQLQQAKPILLNLINLLTGRSLTSPQQANAESVKQQVQSSGTLMESNIARGDTQNLGQDHKALLLRLANQLGQPSTQSDLPKTLSEQIIQQTQQALSRVLVNQITSGLAGQVQDNSADTNTNRTLALDIPVAWQDKTENLQLKIEREAANADDENEEMQYRWKIRLNFEFAESRTLEAELTLEQNRVSVIWSGDSSIRQKVEQQLDQLQQRLEEIGLEVQTLGVRDNLPGNDTQIKPPRNQLIDIKT